MTKQQKKEQKRKAKQLARLLGCRDFVFTNSICVPGDGIVALTVELSWNGKSYWASGAAKRNMVDKWNEEIGVEIATGRALLRIAYQILKDEEVNEIIREPGIFDKIAIDSLQGSPIQEEVLEAISNEYGNVTGVIFVKKGPGPRVMFDKGTRIHADHPNPKAVPGSAKYRGDQMQYGYGVIKPEYVPSGLEAMKEKGMLDEQENEQSATSPGTSEG